MASICCSPPDSVPASCLRRSASSGNSSNTRSRSAGDVALERGRRPSPGSPAPSSAGRRGGPPATWPMPRLTTSCGGMPSMRSPVEADLRRRRAAAGRRRVCRVVVLPAPLAPSSVTISPSPTVERDALERLDRAVADADVVDLEQRSPRASSGRPGSVVHVPAGRPAAVRRSSASASPPRRPR